MHAPRVPLVYEQGLLVKVLTEMREHLPFAILGLDTDNDSAFMNETVQEYWRIVAPRSSRGSVTRASRAGSKPMDGP